MCAHHFGPAMAFLTDAVSYPPQVDSRTRVPQRLTGLISPYTNPVSILTVPFKPSIEALNPLIGSLQGLFSVMREAETLS